MVKRIRWIKKTKIMPGYTEVYLTRAGKKALRNLTTDEHYLIANELTAGGGYDAEHGIIYFVHTSVPVSARWSKVRAILKRAYERSK
ncbi:MAG: hypothetical protein DRJ18_01780 [Candidatus Methanomethylicota archaeon]|nr:MAG: hypothetical protein DRJ18_01780 [Candidatus Verstraetearchaeota archaeon]